MGQATWEFWWAGLPMYCVIVAIYPPQALDTLLCSALLFSRIDTPNRGFKP